MSVRARWFFAALLLTAWIGAALLTIAVVAPGAFASLPSRGLAGLVIGRVLAAVFVSGVVVGLAVAILAGRKGAAVGASVTALLVAAACAVAQFGINPRITKLRAMAGGPLETLTQDDPRRALFGLWHAFSVGALGVAMLAAAISLTFLCFVLHRRDQRLSSVDGAQ